MGRFPICLPANVQIIPIEIFMVKGGFDSPPFLLAYNFVEALI